MCRSKPATAAFASFVWKDGRGRMCGRVGGKGVGRRGG